MGRVTPVQRTLKHLRDEGKVYAVVERYVQRKGMAFGIRQDLFGIIDVVMVDPDDGIIGIQCCGVGSWSSHYKKITEDTELVRGTDHTRPVLALMWMKHATLMLWQWRKILKCRGGKKMIWSPRVHVFTEGDFNG